MRISFALLLCLLWLCLGPPLAAMEKVKVPIKIPFREVLLQRLPFEQEPTLISKNPQQLPPSPSSRPVPLVMSILYDASKYISKNVKLPEGGDFNSLARSLRPSRVEEVGLQRVVLTFPSVKSPESLVSSESWLVFYLRQSHLLTNKCNQVVSVFENTKPVMTHITTLPINFTNADDLLMVNVTQSMQEPQRRPSFVVIIRDSTSYTRDRQLKSFANYVDCSLTRASDVLELHGSRTHPVLLMLSPELAAKNPLKSQRRRKRSATSEETETTATKAPSTTPCQDETKEDANNMCRLEDWYVNTEQLDWDWLIFPERIPLNLCVGHCPTMLGGIFNATGHAVARGLIRMILGPDKYPQNRKSCCVPIKYRKFSMLIERAPGDIYLEVSSDMSASQCGCR